MLTPDGRPHKNKRVNVILEEQNRKISDTSILIRNGEYTFQFIPKSGSERYTIKVKGEKDSNVS